MALVKMCEQCGDAFEKPRTCSRADWGKRRFCTMTCKAASQKGQPPITHGRRPVYVRHTIPCRICGAPTPYHGEKLRSRVHCGAPACKAASHAIQIQRSSESNKATAASGRRKRGSWKGVATVSPQEKALEPWFLEQGWECQVKVLTGVHSIHLPRFVRPDFILTAQKRYIEIDGSSHHKRSRRERDARQDTLLAASGWRGLRIPATDVDINPEAVKERVLAWLNEPS